MGDPAFRRTITAGLEQRLSHRLEGVQRTFERVLDGAHSITSREEIAAIAASMVECVREARELEAAPVGVFVNETAVAALQPIYEAEETIRYVRALLTERHNKRGADPVGKASLGLAMAIASLETSRGIVDGRLAPRHPSAGARRS